MNKLKILFLTYFCQTNYYRCFLQTSKPRYFIELIVKSLSLLNLKESEIYLLGENYILNREGMAVCQGAVHTLINKYKDFCQILPWKQLINLFYTCNMQHLFYNWPHSHKFYWKDLSVRYNWLWYVRLSTNFLYKNSKIG